MNRLKIKKVFLKLKLRTYLLKIWYEEEVKKIEIKKRTSKKKF